MKDNKEFIYVVDVFRTKSKPKLFFYGLIVLLNLPRIVPHLFIFSIHRNRQTILTDTLSRWNLVLSLIFVKHYRNLFYYRIGPIKFLIKWLLPEEASVHVPLSLRLGDSAQFVHNISTFLNAKSIGHSFVCYHHVTIGSSKLGSIEKPRVGNNVTICTGAVIVGNIEIGDNVIIGANAVVTKSVPSNCTIVGNPAKIVRLNGSLVDAPL